ncbi:MAG: hypothetical protein HRU15_03155 [Planctomycetes bacterium]|nr:hypothetical protein [Planctomycetota bacterium]
MMTRKKYAEALLKTRDKKSRRMRIFVYYLILAIIFGLNTYVSNLATPLKLLPQTFLTVIMGFLICSIIATRYFKHCVDFIRWEDVEKCAEQGESDRPPAAITDR